MKPWLLALALTGCLSVPDEPPKECQVTSDCDTANGEVCEEGTCWGNPPAGPFAALLTPPSKRKTELVAREMILDGFPQDGYWGALELGEPVAFTGQIVCPSECTVGELGASIVVTRPSSFPGGPLFRQAFSTDPRTGAFQLVLPKVRPGEPDYTVTVTPDGRQTPIAGRASIAELVPPLRTTLSITSNQTGNTIDLGGQAPLVEITGTIVDAQDNPASNYRVVALGRWDLNAPLAEVSTVAFIGQTDNQFTLRLAEGVIGPVEIVAQPTQDTLQPTLRMTFNPLAAVTAPKLVRPDIDSPLDIPFVVQGTSTGGEVTGVVGAKVTIRGTLGGSTEATFVTSGDTNMAGQVSLRVPGGALASSYRISVVPQNNANVGVVFDRALEPGTNTIKLPDRLAIVGTVLDAQNRPLKDVQVTANQSLRFQWSLGPIPQAFVSGIPAATTATLESGEFVLFVDPFIATNEGELENEDVWGFYDLSFVPSATTNAPLYSQLEIEIPRDPTLKQLPLGSMPLPDAAHLHGLIVDPFGELVEGAELILFRVEDPLAFTQFCEVLNNAPATCPVPALQLGRGTSDVEGMTRLTLPRL